MVTIVHVIGNLDLGGAQMVLWKLLSHMDQDRFSHVVVPMYHEGPLAAKVRELGVPVHDLKMRVGHMRPGTARRITRLLKSTIAISRLARLLKEVDADLVLTWGYHAELLGLGGAKLARLPVVWTIFSSYNPTFTGLFWIMARVAARCSTFPVAVVTDSVAGQQWHAHLGYRPREWRVISNGFDLELFRPDEAARTPVRAELGLAPDALLIGLIGRYNPIKGHATFIAAAGRLVARGVDAHFLLAGPGVTADNAAIWSEVQARNLEDRVHLLGMRDDIERLTAALDIANCASNSESFPNVVGEAMACAVPLVVTDVGDAALMVAGTGIVVPPGNAEAMAAAWADLIALGPAGRRERGQRARVRVVEQYSLARFVAAYEALCEQAIGRSRLA